MAVLDELQWGFHYLIRYALVIYNCNSQMDGHISDDTELQIIFVFVVLFLCVSFFANDIIL